MEIEGPVVVSTPSALRQGNPLPEPTLNSLLHVLLQATSPEPAALSRASAHLSDLEIHPSLWLRLLEIAFERQSPLTPALVAGRQYGSGASSSTALANEDLTRRWTAIRTVAIIRFKNGVEKYWRSRVVNRVTVTIPQDTKAQLRQMLFRCLEEPDRGVALQASVAVSRIARYDFPSSWPTLFDDLQRAMVEAHGRITGPEAENELDRLRLLRAADVCAKTLKELNTVRILAGRIRMTELSQQLLPTLVPMFQQYFAETMPSTDMTTPLAPERLQAWTRTPSLWIRIRTSHLLLKAVSHLAVADTGTLSRSAQAHAGNRTNYARELFQITPGMLQYLRDVRWAAIAMASQGGEHDLQQSILLALQKHLLVFGKLYAALATREKSKAVTWPGWDEVVMWYWQQAREATPDELATTSKTGADAQTDLMQRFPTKLLVQSLTLLQSSLLEWRQTDTLPVQFKDETTLTEMVDVLIGKLMLLTRDDLELWQADAEDWSVAEEAETYNTDVRPAAERALMALSSAAPTRSSKFVSHYIWSRFEAMPSSADDTSIHAILQRDALYAALGRCRDQFDPSDETLSHVIASRLVHEASLSFTDASSWILIRRRIAWSIWEWSEHVIAAHRTAVYQLLVSLLDDVPGKTDAAVRLAAARSLSAMADALEFDSDAFQPFIDASLTRLATLMAGADLHEMDSIKTCTNAMSILIERLGARVAPHLHQLATLVPTLWTMDDPECKARPSIIVFVGRLVRSVELIPHGSEGAGTSLHGIVEVIVQQSLATEAISMLGKDALELWIRTLRSSSQMTDPLFRLLETLPGLLDQPDYCPEACRIAQESTLMAAEPVISRYGDALFAGFAKVVGDPQSPLILHPIAALDVIVQALHAQGVDTMAWATLLDQSGLFPVLVGSLLKVRDSSVVTGYLVALLARLALTMDRTAIFLELVRSAVPRLEGRTETTGGEALLRPMVEMWCNRIDSMASTRKRRITCLGLASILGNADPQREPALYAALPVMVGAWVDTMGDLQPEGGASTDDVSAPAVPTAPPSSPTLSRSYTVQTSPAALRHRSPSPALSIPGLEGIDDADDWLQETSPGRARMTELNRLDPVNTVRLTAFVADSMRRAQAQGGEFFQAGLAGMDPLVLDVFQKDIQR